MEVFGYDLVVIVQILIVVAGCDLFGKVVARMLAKLFEKTPFPENIERSIVRASKYVAYMTGLDNCRCSRFRCYINYNRVRRLEHSYNLRHEGYYSETCIRTPNTNGPAI
jgi:hypothetical protein